MIFKTVGYVTQGGLPVERSQTIEVETTAHVFTDFVGIYTFDVVPFEATTKRTSYTGDIYENTHTAQLLPSGEGDNPHTRAANFLASLYNAGVLDMSEEVFEEFRALTLNLPIYATGNVGSLQGFPSGGWPDHIEINPASSVAVGNGAPTGTRLSDKWNLQGESRNYNWGTMQFTQTAYFEIPTLINLFSRAIELDIIEPSDDLKEWVDENLIAIPTDKSFHWDVYIINYKENTFYGGYVTESVKVRWSCPAVNKATEEQLAADPDYPYRADNTIIELRADKTKAQGFTSEPFYHGLYGNLEAKIPMSKLSSVIGTSDFMKDISNFIPSSKAGDCYLYLAYTFENLGVSDYCIAQIPLNLTTLDASHLYTMNGRRGSTVTIHLGEPTEGVPDDVVGWNDDLREPKEDDTQKTDEDSSDVTSDLGTNSNIGLLTTSYACTESQIQSIGHVLWSDDFLKNISMINNSPIENIIAVKSLPFPIPVTGGANTEIQLGNVKMGVNGIKLPSSFNPVKTIGTFTIPKKFSGHLEWLNWQTRAYIYLPYIGFQELDVSECISANGSKQMTLKYIYDIITGVCTACIYAAGIEIAKYSGNIAIDLPITASNRAQVEVGYVTGALSAIGQLSSLFSNPIGTLAGVASTAVNTIAQQNHFTTQGSPSPSCDAWDEQKAFVIIDQPVYFEPGNYAHDYGYPCNLALTLKNCSGFTKCYNVDVRGFACTEDERDEIKQLLESGVYL